jgi:hypothetical protein
MKAAPGEAGGRLRCGLPDGGRGLAHDQLGRQFEAEESISLPAAISRTVQSRASVVVAWESMPITVAFGLHVRRARQASSQGPPTKRAAQRRSLPVGNTTLSRNSVR